MLNNIKFQGTIGSKNLKDYKYKINWEEKDHNVRVGILNDVLNLDNIGSLDEYWQEVWDCGLCKVNIGTKDTRWEETDVARFLETCGSYLLYSYDKKEKKRRKSFEIDENMSTDDVINDTNYRLNPPIKIEKSDYRLRELFNCTYDEYVEKVSKKNLDIKDKSTWEKIKYNEEKKIELLKEARSNQDILKQQLFDMQEGKELQYRKQLTYEVPNMNVDLRLSKQLSRYGLKNDEILRLEKNIYITRKVTSNVKLYHIQSMLNNVKDYMILVKKSHSNIVTIKPPKCPNVKHILECIDYLDEAHIKGMLSLSEKKLDPSSDMAVIAYDINKKIKEMYSNGELSDRDMYIIEGIQYNIPYTQLAKELDIKSSTLDYAINRICDNIVKSFYEDHMDLYFLNESKGKYNKCSKCGEVKLVSRFDKNGKKGLRSSCKRCESERKK